MSNLDQKTFEQYMTEMVETQDKLGVIQADIVGAKNWREKSWDFQLAAAEEIFEAIDHLRWKWWKNKEGITADDVDWEAVHYEVADVFNFITTYLLKECSDYRVIQTLIKGFNRAEEKLNKEEGINGYQPNITESMKYAKTLVGSLFGHWTYEDSFASYYGDELATTYFKLVQSTGLHFSRLRAIYLAKAELNIFRWNHGFKDGTYKRMWNDVKDDVFLKKIVNMTNENDPNYTTLIATSLERIYSQIQISERVGKEVIGAEQVSVKPKVGYSKAPRPPHENGGHGPEVA